MNEFFRRLRYLLNRRRYDRDLANDMEVHRELAAAEPAVPFGNTLRLREEARDAWGWTWLERLSQDLRYAVRKLWKSPGFTIPALLMLGVGIGVNIAAFGFFNAMFLRPLAVRDPATLVRFERRSPKNYASSLPYPELEFFREHSRTLSTVLGITSARLAMEGEDKRINAGFVTANLFSDLGVPAKWGRVFGSRDDSPAGDPPVVLGYGFWQSHFASDPGVPGRILRLNGKRAVIVGVAPPDFSGLSLNSPDLWVPITRQPSLVEGSRMLTDFSVDGAGVMMWARPQPGLPVSAVRDEIRSLAAQLRRIHPNDIWENETLSAQPGGYVSSMTDGNSHGTGGQPENKLLPIFALIGCLAFLILAVTCGNLGSLLLARGVSREREVAIRLAIGAGRARLARQLFTESLVLALFGSLAGLAFGYIVLRFLMALTSVPVWISPAPDWRVAAFAVAAGFTSALLFGLTPALQIARQKHRATLLRQVLLGGQVAGSCILVIVAGLLVRALDRATSASPGFDYLQVVSVEPSLASHGYSAAAAGVWLEEFRSRLRALPGIQSVTFASSPPLGHTTTVAEIAVEGRALPIHLSRIDSEFFRTMNIPLLRGRNLKPGREEVVVSQSMARRLWPGQDPLGKRVPLDNGNYVVAGVAGNARGTALEDPDAVECYFPAAASDLPSMTVLVKAAGPPEGLVHYLASTARSIDPAIFPEVETMKSSFHRKIQGTEYSAVAVGLLGAVALLLASLGIVGLVAYAVSQRTKEIGVRMALGARPRHVLSIVLRQLSSPVAIGLLAGVAGAGWLAQILRRQLYGIGSLDPVAYVAAVGLFAFAAAVAALLPARRALRLNPLTALRHE